MGEIRVEYKTVFGIPGTVHLSLVYRPDANSPYQDWQIIRFGPTIPGAFPPWGPMVGEINNFHKLSDDVYNFGYFSEFVSPEDENPFCRLDRDTTSRISR